MTLAALIAGALAVAPSVASAQFGVSSFSTSASTSQASAHADLSTSFKLSTDALGNPSEQLKDVQVALPPGVIGNPQSAPLCSAHAFQSFNCPSDAQVGVLNGSFITSPGVSTTLTALPVSTTLTAPVAPCGFCGSETIAVASTAGMSSGDQLGIGTGASALTANATAGDTSITVGSTAGFSAGHTIAINPGFSAETATIATVTDATHLALTTPLANDYASGTAVSSEDTVTIANVVDATDLQLAAGVQNSHLAGEPVAEDTITVASSTGFQGSDGNNTITIGTGANAQTDTVVFFPGDPNHLTLGAPLTGTHAVGDPVTHTAVATSAPIPLFNMQATPGHVATFAASLLFVTILVQVDVRNDGTYGLTANISDISTLITLAGSTLTLWGVPGDPSHDSLRCGEIGQYCQNPGGGPGVPSGAPITPFMSNPSDCSGGPLTSTITADSWQHPGQFVSSTATQGAPTGCNLLSMSPTLTVAPDTSKADTPAGYDVDLRVPQDNDPYGLATPDLQNVSVTLPAGTSLSPPVANGLQGCSDAQYAAASCPDASKVGTVSITSPLLADALTGSIYLAAPTPSAMYRIFLIASADNVTVRLTGVVTPDPNTGQLTALFSQNPQQPFSDFHLRFFSGPLAPLANPATCGTATTTSQITSYGGATASPGSSFSVDADGAGGACPSPTPFTPSFTAGSTQPTAGAFSPFSVTVSRADGQQNLASLSVQTPPGLLAMLSSRTPCPEPQASQGTCGPQSLVGSTTVGAGAGDHPLYLSGQVFLTGPYKNGQFGLAIVVPAIAGPFNLGTVVVRAAITVDPNDAHLTIISDALPQILQGIPLRLRSINVSINQPGFTLNPTNCTPTQVGGTITSAQGAGVSVSSPFEIGGCAGLSFTPRLTATTSAHTSTANGASLDVRVSSPGQANLRSVAVTLPKQLSARLSSLSQLCPKATFAANPANCPANSVVGTSTAVTPILPVPLTGPVYLVLGGANGLPDLDAVISGDGVQVKLIGSIVLKNNLTTSTFGSIPDVQLSSFELNLPQGPHGALAATGKLCTALLMPVSFVAQDGDQVHSVTHVTVTGCPTLSITKTKVKGSSLLVTVKTSDKGTVKLSGAGLQTTTKRNLAAGSHQIKVAFTKAGKRLAKAHKRTSVTASLTASAGSASKSASVKL